MTGIQRIAVLKRFERISRSYQVARGGQTVLVSIHSNAAPNDNPLPSGIETLYYSLGGYELGKLIQDNLVECTGWKDRGLRKTYEKRVVNGEEKVIYKVALTRYTPMICVLTESGFYTNFDQCMALLDDQVRQQIAEAHIDGISKYIQKLKFDGRIS